MSTKMSVKRIVRALGIVTVVLILTGSVGASTLARPFSRVVAVQGQADGDPLYLKAVVSNQTLIGMLTVSGKDDRPWMDMRGQVYLLSSTGQRLAIIPLEPISPGEFRLIAPLSRLTAPGYLDIHLPDAKASGVSHAMYRVDPAGPVLARVDGLPMESADHSPLAVRATGGPDMFGYTWDDAATYGWIDTSGGTAVTMRDDDYVGPLSIEFTFNYYGKDCTQFYIDSNGFLSFADNGKSFYNHSGYGLPSPARPNNIIAPFWEDFDPSQGGTIRYQTMGSAPNRSLVVEWSGVPLYGDPSTDTQSVQMVLYEGSNQIRFQYPNTRSASRGDLRTSIVEIENDDGTIGLTYPYTIPVNVNRAVLFSYSQPTYNVFLTPDRQGGSAAAGSSAAFHLLVKNLGSSPDTYTMSRAGYTGSDWAVSFYQSDGVTLLPGSSTGSIAAGDQKDIVVKVSVPGGTSVGNWTRATVQAQGSGGAPGTATVDAMLTPSFYQAYTDNDSGDGTEDSENYVDPVVNGENRTRRLTTDQDDSNYAGTAATPDGNAVTVWNTTYRNSNSKSVSEIQYAVVGPGGGFVRSITRLTNNSSATQNTFDFSPAVAVVTPTGNILIDWELQVDSSGDGVLDRYNAWYTILTGGGATVKAPTPLTTNSSDYPRDYPPSVTALTGGNFLLTWEHAEVQGGPEDIYYAVLNSSGDVVKSPTPLTSGGINVTPRAASFPNGKAAIVWTAYNSYGNGEIYYAVLNADGSSPSSLTPITTNGNSASSMYADAAALSDGQLAVAWTQTTTDLQTQYTIVSPGGQQGISGKVTNNGSGTSGLTLNLMKYDGVNPTRYMTTTTQANGSYIFTGASSLTSGQYYRVRYLNDPSGGNTSNSGYVAYWIGRVITSTEGTNVPGVNFDIANVVLQSPSNNSTLPLPVTFQWTPRGIAGDYYHWSLVDLNTFDIICWGPSQATGSLILDGTGFSNCSLSYGVQYGWYVNIFAGTDLSAGYGASYSLNTVTLSSGGGAAPVASFASSSPDVLGETTILTNTTTGTEPISYLWAFGDGLTSTDKNPTHLYAAAGTYTVWLTATNSYGTNATHGTVQITPPSAGIFGKVTASGSGVGSLTLNLVKYDGVSESTYMTTTTQSDGSYSFVGAGSLTSGQYYYVRYLNGSGGNLLNTNYVAYWFGPSVNSYTAGTNASGGNFDIVDIPLVSPLGGINQTISAAFQWTPRGVAGDNYRWAVQNLSTSSRCLGPYQTTGSFTLDSTGFSNCGLTYNTRYGWFVYAVAGTNMDSFGVSLYYRTITFTTGLANLQSGVGTELLLNPPFKGQGEPCKQQVLASLDVQRPATPQAIYTIPNAINNMNVYVSLAVDSQDHLIMTWLDSGWYNPFFDRWLVTRPTASYLFYALADKNGNILTPATILQRTRRSYLWSSWNGYGNAYMPPQASSGQLKVFLPMVVKNYPPPPPPPVVTNGGFESGLTAWTLAGSGKLAPAVVSSPAHGGSSHAAVLGYLTAPCQGEPHGDSSLSQSIQVPSSGSAQLSLYYRIMTYDRLVGDKYDWFAVYINGALVLQTGRVSQTTVTGCASNPYDTDWQQFAYDLSAYQGQTVEIRLVNHTSDQWYNTWTYVDDVSVN